METCTAWPLTAQSPRSPAAGSDSIRPLNSKWSLFLSLPATRLAANKLISRASEIATKPIRTLIMISSPQAVAEVPEALAGGNSEAVAVERPLIPFHVRLFWFAERHHTTPPVP